MTALEVADMWFQLQHKNKTLRRMILALMSDKEKKDLYLYHLTMISMLKPEDPLYLIDGEIFEAQKDW